jgi:acyl-coenzyme A synthetase/AMP-(fatty) acid ligase
MLIAQYIYHFARVTPTAPAMIHNGIPISYSVFAAAIFRAGIEISSCGVQSPGTVAVKVRNLAECWVITLALQAKGYTTICISSLELLESMQVKNLAAIFVTVEEGGHTPARVDSAPVFSIAKPVFEDAGSVEIAAPPGFGDGGGHILYTSGTTGSYKMYVLTARTQRQRDLERVEYYGWGDKTRFYGLNFGLWTAVGYNLSPSVWSVGGTVLLDQENDWTGHFFDSNPSFAFLLPDQALQLCGEKNPEFPNAAKSSGPVLYICGGFLGNRVARKLLENVSRNIVITYGSSEINSASFEQPYQSIEDLNWLTPTGNRVIEIVNEREQICPVNEEGHLRVKLTGLDVQSYLNDPEASSNAFRNGYFYPGDIAVQREDGRFGILGRTADVVNLAGQKRSVAPIEANLRNILQVDYVCVFSGIDSSGETVIVIAMEANSPPDEDRLSHVGREFSQWGEVRFAYVSHFPRTQSGTSKIDRKRLRDLVFPREMCD